MKRMKPHYFTDEQDAFLRANVTGISNKELTDLFNKRFGLQLIVEQIKTAKRNRSLSNGIGQGFKHGFIPWNKGTKGLVKPNRTTYQVGHKPHNYRPVGSELTTKHGYIVVKVADPDIRKYKHVLVWEAAHGPVPKNHAVIFADKDKTNFDLDNLILVHKSLLGTLNMNKLITTDAESTKTGVLIAEIIQKVSKLQKEV